MRLHSLYKTELNPGFPDSKEHGSYVHKRRQATPVCDNTIKRSMRLVGFHEVENS
jgi:hypothetical protein